MDFKTKFFLGFLTSLAIINTILDLAFRFTISYEVGASWMVWTIVILTIAIAVATVAIAFMMKRKKGGKS